MEPAEFCAALPKLKLRVLGEGLASRPITALPYRVFEPAGASAAFGSGAGLSDSEFR
jgi:hypothetical protein